MARLPDSQVKFYDEAFVLKDPNGKPLGDVPFKVKTSSGYVSGISSGGGEETRIPTDAIESVKFEIQWHELEP